MSKEKAVPIGRSKINIAATESGLAFAKCTEHVALNADTASAEDIIHNMRFMAHSIGFDAGAKWLSDKIKSLGTLWPSTVMEKDATHILIKREDLDDLFKEDQHNE